mmetsp:Transcript_17735/g.30743  ORF Transcript_17735/g.30743 Transcript_17735/m.30743 type:complete len:543 (-) Transcript_17735:573-2201(-)
MFFSVGNRLFSWMSHSPAQADRSNAAAIKICCCWLKYRARKEFVHLRRRQLLVRQQRCELVQQQEQQQYLELLEADDFVDGGTSHFSDEVQEPQYDVCFRLILDDEGLQRATIIRCEGHHFSRLSRLMNHEYRGFCEDEPVFQTHKEKRRRLLLEEEETEKLRAETQQLDFALLQQDLADLEQSEERERMVLESGALAGPGFHWCGGSEETFNFIHTMSRMQRSAKVIQRFWHAYRHRQQSLRWIELHQETKYLVKEERILRAQLGRVCQVQLLDLQRNFIPQPRTHCSQGYLGRKKKSLTAALESFYADFEGATHNTQPTEGAVRHSPRPQLGKRRPSSFGVSMYAPPPLVPPPAAKRPTPQGEQSRKALPLSTTPLFRTTETPVSIASTGLLTPTFFNGPSKPGNCQGDPLTPVSARSVATTLTEDCGGSDDEASGLSSLGGTPIASPFDGTDFRPGACLRRASILLAGFETQHIPSPSMSVCKQRLSPLRPALQSAENRPESKSLYPRKAPRRDPFGMVAAPRNIAGALPRRQLPGLDF